MIIGVPKEIKLQEHRIGLTPESVKILFEKGHKVIVETNGGFEAGFTNEDYQRSGALIYNNAKDILTNSLGRGLSSSGNSLADALLEEMRLIHKCIKIEKGVTVNVVWQEGFSLDNDED